MVNCPLLKSQVSWVRIIYDRQDDGLMMSCMIFVLCLMLFCHNCRLEMFKFVDGVTHLMSGKCLPAPSVRFSRQH